MQIFKEPLPDNGKLREQYFVKIVELLVESRLSSYSLYITHAIGYALFSSILMFILIPIGTLIVVPNSDFAMEFLDTSILAMLLFIIVTFAELLRTIGFIWFRRCQDNYSKSTVLFVGLLSVAALCFCLFVSINYLIPIQLIK